MSKSWLLAGVMLATLGGAAMAAEPVAPVAATAADAVSQPLTLKRVFASPDLAGPQPRALRLSPDGALLTSLRPRADEKERFDLWALDTRTGREWMLVDSRQVGTGAELSEAEKMQRERARIGGSKGIVAYDWAPDGKSLLVPLDGDLYLATLDGQVTRLTSQPGGQLNPAVSPRGGFVSFVRGQNLFVQPLAPGGTARAVTSGGAGTIHWGEAEFVSQEEMGRSTGYWWSPDDKRIAVERFDEAPVGIVNRAAIGAEGTRVFAQRYPAAGTPNVLVELYVMNADGTGQVKVDLGANPDIYLARVDWTPDGKTLLVQRQSRDQKTLDMLAVDPATGKATILFTEKSGERSWLNLTDVFPQKDGSLIWRSERDGYGHVWCFARGKWTQLTKGPWVVTGIVGIDQKAGRVYFLGNKDDALAQQLYAVDIAHPGTITRLTEPGWWNSATMDQAASRVIVTRSSTSQPPQTYLADVTGKRLSWVNENPVVPGHPYYPYLAAHQPMTFGTFKAADGTELHYQMITPPLVAGKKYPVFFEHYGGPHAQQVTRGWHNPLAQYLVSQGWVYFQIDNRGSYNRGKAFEDQIYRAMGGVEVADQRAGAAWIKAQPFVDPGKIAIYGWSYGGYMTLKMLQADQGLYAAGVSGAPVTKWELYDTHYTERYMGSPVADAAAYATSNALGDAVKITDPLLLIHGMADDNVVFENSTAFAAEMQKRTRPFEMMFYPGYTHRVAGPGISEHLWTTILAFLDREVKNKPAK